MIVTTIQEANAIANECCPCELPSCDDPQKECESITVGECSEKMPVDNTLDPGDIPVPPEDACIWMMGKIVEYIVETVDQPNYGFGDGLLNSTQTEITEWRRRGDEGACFDEIYELSSTYDATINFVGETEEESVTVVIVAAASYKPPGEWTGSSTTTQTGPYGANVVIVSDYLGDSRNFTPDSSWRYLGDYKWEKVTVLTDPGFGNITATQRVTYIPATAEALLEELEEKEFPDDINGSLCYAEVLKDPDCEDSIRSVTKSRYRMTVPASWISPYDAWIEGGSVGPEPPIRSTYELEWDEGFFPTEWDEWNNGDREDPEPTPVPELVAERSWTWDGNKTEEGRWSPWYNINPDLRPGQVRPVNLMIVCWKSAKIGTKPTASGEIHEFPEPEP
jgi:hypothetical protein